MPLTAPDWVSIPNAEIAGAVMQWFLDSINEVFEDAGVELPGRQYLAIGQTAHDCEQLTVSFLQMYVGTPGARVDEAQRCHSPRTAVLQIQLVRCVPQPESRSLVDPLAMTENTELKTADAWLLMDAAMYAANLVEDNTGILADVSVTNPQGAYQAIQLNLSIGLP